MPLIHESRQGLVGQAYPGLGGVGGELAGGLAGQPFGVAHVAFFTGGGNEKQIVGHERK